MRSSSSGSLRQAKRCGSSFFCFFPSASGGEGGRREARDSLLGHLTTLQFIHSSYTDDKNDK